MQPGAKFIFVVLAAMLATAWLAIAAPPGPVPNPGHSGPQIAGGSITGAELADNLALTGNASINSPTLVVAGDSVGIGTASPQGNLNLNGSTSAHFVVSASTAGGAGLGPAITLVDTFLGDVISAPAWQIRQSSDKFSIGRRDSLFGSFTLPIPFVITNDSKVGIGTAFPNSTLHVIGGANITGGLSTSIVSASNYGLRTGPLGSIDIIDIGNAVSMQFFFNTTARTFQILDPILFPAPAALTVDVANKRVGINTTSPNATLHVIGNLSVGPGTVTISETGIKFPDGSFQSAAGGAGLNQTGCHFVSAPGFAACTSGTNQISAATCPSDEFVAGVRLRGCATSANGNFDILCCKSST